MLYKEPKTEQEALNIFWNANIVNITRVVKLKCHEDCDITDFVEEVVGDIPAVYEDPEFDIEEFYKQGKKAITHYTRVETGMDPKFWTLAVTEVDGEMVHGCFINGSDKEEVGPIPAINGRCFKDDSTYDYGNELEENGKEASIEEVAADLNDKLAGTGVHVKVIENKPEMTKLRTRAIEEIKNVFQEMINLYEPGSFPTVGTIAEEIFKENWAIGNVGCPSFPEDKKYAEKSATKLFKVFSENILLTQVLLPIQEGMEEYNAANFIDTLFGLDPMIGINMGTSLAGINHEFHVKVCPSFIEYARRYMDE